MPDVRNDDQINDEHHDDDPNPQPEAPRPRGIRHPPDRLMYYGPGEAMAMGLFQTSVLPAETGWQSSVVVPVHPYLFPLPNHPAPNPYQFPLPNHPAAYPYQFPLPNHLTPTYGHPMRYQPTVPQPIY